MTDEEHDEILLDADEFETETLELIKTVDIDWMSVFIAAINIAGLALVEAQLNHDKRQELADDTASFLKTAAAPEACNNDSLAQATSDILSS